MIVELLFKFKYRFLSLVNGNCIRIDVPTTSKVGRGCRIDKFSSIGKYTFINTNTILTKSSIGNYCSVGSEVIIGPGEHLLSTISTSALFYKDTYEMLTRKQCIIGNDVWIGTRAIIKRGVTVGDGAVIGANSVVTKDVPSFAIVVGSPAKVIKYRFSNEKIKKIFESAWWDKELEQAQDKIKDLSL